MKYLIILSLIISSVFAQTKLDTIVFKKVNEYRKSIGVSPVEWNVICYKASEHHSKHLIRKNLSVFPSLFCGHSEDTLKNPSDRLDKYYNKKTDGGLGEVCQSFGHNIRHKDSTSYYEILAEKIVTNWKNSKDHNKILIDPKYKTFGVSSLYFTKPNGFKNSSHYIFVSTAVFYTKYQ
jgi:uncharacterized protein YkwD